MYELSTSFIAHKADIVGLTVDADDSIVSCSRDKTIKIWKYNENTRQFFEAEIFYSKNNLTCKFPTCVCILPPSDFFECGLILTGDNDNRIFVYEPSNPIPIRHIRAHSNAVSKMASCTEPNVFLSASWDATVKMWLVTEQSLKCLLIIESHSASIWAVLQMKRKFILTGSADKLIRIFDFDGNLVKTLNGHEDCVRDLVEINDEEILSCSNDATVRRWSVNTGKCLEILTGHPNYVYSVRIIGDLILSCGEDKCLLLWSQGKPVQTITLPARSIWTVSVLSNNDIVVGSSDGVLRIFTANKNRRADKKTLLGFTEECANQDAIKITMGRKRFKRLPGLNILSKPGVKEGQKVLVRLVRESEKVNCFSWSITENKWKNIGIVDIDFVPLTSSSFRFESENSVSGSDKKLIPKEPKNKLCCAICRRTFSNKSRIRKHVIESNHTIARRTSKFLLSILPNMRPYHVVSFKRNGSSFKLELCFENMNTRPDLRAWIKHFAELNNSIYRRIKIKQYPRGEFKYFELYRCLYRHSAKTQSRKMHYRAANCKSTIRGFLNRSSVDNSCYGKININFYHNHPFEDPNKFKKPSPEVRDTFRHMCHDGLSPSNALFIHRKQLEFQSLGTSKDLLLDRSVCPEYDWVRRFFNRVKARISSKMEKIAAKTQIPKESTSIRDEQSEIEKVSTVYELEQSDEMKSEEIILKVGIEELSESGPHILREIVDQFAIFLTKLKEDPSYYEEGIRSMSCELKNLYQSTAESRLIALYSFNKCLDDAKR